MTAVTGLLGIVVGAVLAGGLKALADRSDRSRRARVSARLLYLALVEAQAVMETSAEHGRFHPASEDWHRFDVEWRRERDSLATAMYVEDFTSVALAFLGIAALARLKSDTDEEVAAGTSVDWDEMLEMIELYGPVLAAAQSLLRETGRTRRERRAERR